MRIILGLVVALVCAIGALALASMGSPQALRPAPQPAATRIDNVRIVSMNPDAPEVQDGLSVLVVDGVIQAVAPAAEIETPEGARVIDGGGRTLTPGLIDAHIHLWDEAELCAYLAHGVTSVRNMGGMPFHLPLARRIAAGRILGPDFVTTGTILNSPGPNQQPIHQIVRNAAEAHAAVQAQHAAGYRTLKLYSNLTTEAYAAILDEGARLDMAIVGHTPEGVRGEGVPHERPFEIAFEDVLDDGYVTIEHTESIVWHGLRDQLDEAQMRALAQRIAAAGVTVTPTLIAHDNLVRVAASDGAYLERPGVEALNPLLRRLEADTYAHWSAEDPDRREAPRAAFYLVATRLMHEVGVPIIAGTDAGIFTNIPGSSMTRELELLVRAGLSPHEALRAATATAGPAIGLPDRGRIAPGFRANLALFDGDPLADISAIEQPSAVMIGGSWLDADDLTALHECARNGSMLRTGRRVIEMLLSL